MAIAVKLRCSECLTVRELNLKGEDKEIVCVVCGRRMANLPEADQTQMQQMQKSQYIMGFVSLALFIGAIVCFFIWAGDMSWISGKVANAAGQLEAAKGPIEPQVGPMAGAIVCGLASLVVGIFASLKRFVVEF